MIKIQPIRAKPRRTWTNESGEPCVKVHLGAQDVCEEDWSGTHLVRPARFLFHPGYNPQTDENDIAILRLKRDIRFGAKVWCEIVRVVRCDLTRPVFRSG